jgi:hypothetical protein
MNGVGVQVIEKQRIPKMKDIVSALMAHTMKELRNESDS